MKVNLAVDSVPLGARLALVASLAGLLLGILLGMFAGGSQFRGSSDDWGALPPLADVPVQNLALLLRESGKWDSGAEQDAPVESSIPGRPGVFQYLKLIAIIEDTTRSAVMRIADRGREQVEKGGILLPVSGDLVQMRQGDEPFEGWVLVELGTTRLRFESADSGTVEYDLFGEF